MTEVINFQAAKEKREEKNFDKLIESKINEENQMLELSVQLGLEVIDFLYDNGYDVESRPESIADIFLMLDAIKGIMHRCIDDEYHINQVADSLFGVEDSKETMQRFFYGNEESS